jgi:HEAT repeat protein
MLSPQTFATHLARAVDLFRDPDAKALQKTELRALMGLLSMAPVSLKTDGGSLVINGTVVEGVIYRPLVERLSLHNVREITLPSDAPPGDIFNLLKTLADQPTSDNVPTRLRSTGTQRVTVEIARLFSEVDSQDGQKPDPAKPAPKIELGVDGILQGNMEDMPMPEPRKSSEVLSRAVMPPPGALDAPPMQRYSDAVPRPDDGPPVPFSASGRPSSIDSSLTDLAENPTSPAVSGILASLGEQVDAAVRSGRFEQAAKILAGIVRQEQLIPDTGPRRQYGIALKRMYSRPLLDGLVQLLDAPGHEADASLALQRGGTEAVDILLEQLVASTTVSERRHAFDALSKMREAAGQIVHMMGHAQWYVVRNMAELVGELGLEDAVPALVKQLDHEDERVRKAVALALAKIGTKSVVEPLRRALRDSSADVRMQAAIGVGGRKANALAMPLVVALEEEKNPDVIRELVLGLGRIGSPDAVQALIKLAQPAGRFIGRKPAGLRLAAVESLRLAATPAALGALQGLATDSDRQVKTAALAAVAELKR